jgi:hypothetical protein
MRGNKGSQLVEDPDQRGFGGQQLLRDGHQIPCRDRDSPEGVVNVL